MISLFIALLVQAPVPELRAVNPCVEGGVRESVVFLGTTAKDEAGKEVDRYFGTGFLVAHDGIKYLFTARHVVKNFIDRRPEGQPFFGAVNDASGRKVIQRLDDLPKRLKAGWIYSDVADIAVTPFPSGPEWKIRTVASDNVLADRQLAELQEVFFVSFQPGLEAKDKIRPIFRRGTVALIDPGEVYLDAFVFPGNSGSPVFTQFAAASVASTGAFMGTDPLACRLVGMVASYLSYTDRAVSEQTGRPRVVFEENTGLAHIITADQLRLLIESPEFVAQHARLRKSLQP